MRDKFTIDIKKKTKNPIIYLKLMQKKEEEDKEDIPGSNINTFYIMSSKCHPPTHWTNTLKSNP